jgi:hypothetical protein
MILVQREKNGTTGKRGNVPRRAAVRSRREERLRARAGNMRAPDSKIISGGVKVK